MMRCDCCNKRLNDYEATLKSKEFGVYLNTCVKCLRDLNIETIGRPELAPKAILEDDLAEEYSPDDIQEYQDIIHYLDDGIGEDSR